MGGWDGLICIRVKNATKSKEEERLGKEHVLAEVIRISEMMLVLRCSSSSLARCMPCQSAVGVARVGSASELVPLSDSRACTKRP